MGDPAGIMPERQQLNEWCSAARAWWGQHNQTIPNQHEFLLELDVLLKQVWDQDASIFGGNALAWRLPLEEQWAFFLVCIEAAASNNCNPEDLEFAIGCVE